MLQMHEAKKIPSREQVYHGRGNGGLFSYSSGDVNGSGNVNGNGNENKWEALVRRTFRGSNS